MEEIIVYTYRATVRDRHVLMGKKVYTCYKQHIMYGIIVIEDIAKVAPGTVLGSYYSETLIFTHPLYSIVLETVDGVKLDTGVDFLYLRTTHDKAGKPMVEVIKPYTINA